MPKLRSTCVTIIWCLKFSQESSSEEINITKGQGRSEEVFPFIEANYDKQGQCDLGEMFSERKKKYSCQDFTEAELQRTEAECTLWRGSLRFTLRTQGGS